MEINTKKEEYIDKNAESMWIWELSDILGINKDEIKKYCSTKGIKYRGKTKKFTDEQVYFISKNDGKFSAKELEKELNRVYPMDRVNVGNIYSFCNKYGIKLIINKIRQEKITEEENNTLSEKDKEYIKLNTSKMTIEEISRVIGVNEKIIYKYCVSNRVDYIGKSSKITYNQAKIALNSGGKFTRAEMTEKLNELDTENKVEPFQVVNFCNKYNIKLLSFSNEHGKKETTEDKIIRIDEYIINNYIEYSIEEIAKNLDMNKERITKYIDSKPKKFKELKMVKYYKENPKTTVLELSKMFKYTIKQVIVSCREHGYDMGIGEKEEEEKIKYKLTGEEIKFINDNFEKMTKGEVAKELGIDIHAIEKYRKDKGIQFKHNKYMFTEEQMKYIEDNAKEKTPYQIELELNYEIPLKPIVDYIEKLVRENRIEIKEGSIKQGAIKLTEYQKKYIEENAPNRNAKQIGKELKIKEGTIRSYCRRNNIKILKEVRG